MKHDEGSTKSDTGAVIERLVDSAAPVKRPVGAGLSTTVWVTCSLVLIGVAFATALTLRTDLSAMAGQGWFIVNLAALAAVFACASFAGFVSALPGRAQPWRALLGLRLALLAFFGTLLPSLTHLGLTGGLRVGMGAGGLRCSATLAALAFVPGVLLYFSLKRLAPVNPAATARMIGLAMGAMGAFGLGLDCMVLNPVHILVYHGLPILLLGLVGTVLGRRILSW